MKYKVHIRNNETGEIVTRPSDDDWDERFTSFYYSNGNMSCDCNRYLEFMRGKTDNESFCGDTKCGDNLYSIDKIVLDDGTVVYSETP